MPPDQQYDLNLALETARSRGIIAVKAIMASDEMLDEETAAVRMDCPLPDLLAAHKSGRVFGVEYDGRFYFPDWQFRYDGQPYDEIPEIISLFEGRQWEMYRFMKAEHSGLNGSTAIDVMRISRQPRLKPIAESWIEGGYA